MTHTKRCTCGPYPVIDITSLHTFPSSNVTKQENNIVREQIQNACKQFGCFHVLIKKDHEAIIVLDSKDDDKIKQDSSLNSTIPSTSRFSCLSPLMDETLVRETVEELFQDSFIKSCRKESNSNTRSSNDILLDNHHDDGILSVSFPYKDTASSIITKTPQQPQSVHSQITTEFICEATFRDRAAESGSIAKANDETNDNHNHNNSPNENVKLQKKGEPKQSWEFFRCQQDHQPPPVTSNNDNTTSSSSSCTISSDSSAKQVDHTITKLSILRDYTNALHSVASAILSPFAIDDIPPHTFMTSSCANCHLCTTDQNDRFSTHSNIHRTPNSSATTDPKYNHNVMKQQGYSSHGKKCNIDLLRVFRYDALLTDDERFTNLGSSPHTDWGSLTVVWQDSKGGLQIFCHEHQLWNNVDIMESFHKDSNVYSAQETDDTTVRIMDDYVRFFIHVGDFTSLSMNALYSTPGHEDSSDNTTAERNTSMQTMMNDEVIWPSPLHRVICPKRHSSSTSLQAKGNETNNSRISLVYFLYPPLGVSLKDAHQRLFHSHNNKQQQQQQQQNILDRNTISESQTFPFERYILLKDQSSQSVSDSNLDEVISNRNPIIKEHQQSRCNTHTKNERTVARIKYNDVYSNPFHDVILQKWGQVQRTEIP